MIITLSQFLWSCSDKAEKLYWVEKNTEHRSDLLYLAESLNVEPIPADSVEMFLTWEETQNIKPLESQLHAKDTIFQKLPIYKDLGKIFESQHYKIHIIFRDGNDSIGRDYKFIVRTYQPDWKIIDSYELAIWNDRKKEYCFGSVDNDLVIRKSCDKSEEFELKKISSSGKILNMSI